MNEKELGKALLGGEQSALDVAALTQRVLMRDRRRVWILGIVCVIAWMAVVMLPWATILPMIAKIAQTSLVPPADATAMGREERLRLAIAIKEGIVATFLGSVASMLVAALCTVCLIVVSRRATLRQVNARLAEISDQLKTLAVKRD
jgi:ABC-type Fe3+ transport system permease subunit